jgi:hypothetical protein
VSCVLCLVSCVLRLASCVLFACVCVFFFSFLLSSFGLEERSTEATI